MSVQIQSSAPVRETSLRSLKQKMKRALSAGSTTSADTDTVLCVKADYRAEGPRGSADSGSVEQPEGKEEESFDNGGSSRERSPQPPSFPRGDELCPAVRQQREGEGKGKGSRILQLPELLPGKSNSQSPTAAFDSATPSETRSGGESVGDFTAVGRAEVGLENLGNTCFMNAALQCLLHIEPLVAFFLQGNIEQHLNLASPKKGNLALSFGQLVRDVYRQRAHGSVTPTNLQRAVCVHAPYLMDLQQQDSQEFLRFLLDGIAEDLCRKHSLGDAMRTGMGLQLKLSSPSTRTSGTSSGKASNSPVSRKNNNDIAAEKRRCSTAGPAVSRNGSSDVSDSTIGSAVALPLPFSSAPTSPFKDESVGAEGADRMDFSRTAPEHLQSAIASLDMRDAEADVAQADVEEADAGADVEVDAGADAGTDAGADAGADVEVDIDPDEDADANADAELDPFEGSADSSLHVYRSVSAGASTKTKTRPERLRQEARQGRENAGDSPVRSAGGGGSESGSGSKTSSRLRVRAAVDQSRQQGDEEGEGQVEEQGRESSLTGSGSASPPVPEYPTPDVARIAAVLRSADESFLPDTDGDDRGDGEGGDELGPTHCVQRRLRREAPSQVGEDPELTAAPPVARRWLLARREAELQWTRYMKLNDSVITDMFAGQLQSTVECLTCGHRSSTYDPFLDLSVPISSDAEPTPPKSFLGSLRHSVAGAGDSKSTLEKCLEKFTAEEVLDNENMYLCEKCSTKRKSIKTLSIFKYPRVLVIHIKRFRYSSARRVKLFDDVKFPTSGLNLEPFVSADLPPMAPASGKGQSRAGILKSNNESAKEGATEESREEGALPPEYQGLLRQVAPVYDLIGVCNHHGTLNSGHYIAHADTSGAGARDPKKWMKFNDARVSPAQPSAVSGPTAYVLFYRLLERQP